MKKTSLPPHFNCCHLRNWNEAIFDDIDIIWYQHQYQCYHMTKMSCCTSFWSFEPKNTVMYLLIPSASHDANTSNECISLPKSHVAPHINYHDQINAVGPLLMPLAAHDADTSANDVKFLKKPCCISFWLPGTKECNGIIDDAISFHVMPKLYHMAKKSCCILFQSPGPNKQIVPLTMPSVSCDAQAGANSITWTKELCHTLFQLSSPNEQSGAIDDAVSITWLKS